jgi:hypothetical protein
MKKLYLLFIVFIIIFLSGTFYKSIYKNSKEQFNSAEGAKTVFQFLNPIDIDNIDANDNIIMGKQKIKCNPDGLCMIDARF